MNVLLLVLNLVGNGKAMDHSGMMNYINDTGQIEILDSTSLTQLLELGVMQGCKKQMLYWEQAMLITGL